MKPLRIISIGLAFVLITIVAIFISGRFVASAQASLGNSGIPAHCWIDSTTGKVFPGGNEFFKCWTTSGISFTSSGQRVPEGYFFIVTDTVVTPDMPGIVSTYMFLYVAYGESGRSYGLDFRDKSGNSYGHHFQVPYLILPEGYRLEVTLSASSEAPVKAYVSGLLVTNLNFLPVVVK